MKYAKLNNGALTFAPKNKGNIINYNINVEEMTKDGYKPFVEAEKEDGKAYEYSYEETESEIREIATEIIIDEAELQRQEREQLINEAKQQLDELDLKSVRALRAVVAGTSTNADLLKLEEIETQVQEIRKELETLLSE